MIVSLMMAILAIIGTIVGIGLVFVLVPPALEAYVHFRKRREMICPETMGQAAIRLDAKYAAVTSAIGVTRLRVLNCSRWPEGHDCARGCLNQIPY